MNSVTELALIYPYFDPPGNKSLFRFPPLGLGYIASYLQERGYSVSIVDCTFLDYGEALRRVRALKPSVIGIYSMFTMKAQTLRLAQALREDSHLLICGGPLPTTDPLSFLDSFDIVVAGEGEQTVYELMKAYEKGEGFSQVDGLIYKEQEGTLLKAHQRGHDRIVQTPPRKLIPDLDSLPLPAWDLFENESYKDYYRKRHSYTTTSIMTSRGCPFQCDFCSKPIFGDTFRERTAGNIVDEVEKVLSLGYERVFFNDDCFTLTKQRVFDVCDEIVRRGLNFKWECLSRVDTLDKEAAERMKKAGCTRIFFGLESGSDEILRVMNKKATALRAREAVEVAASAGIKTGAFFILGYPGETNETLLDTIEFATSLPLDYLSFTMPYPIPGTGLYEKVKGQLMRQDLDPQRKGLIDHQLIFESPMSERKLKFAMAKAMIQFYMRKHLRGMAPLVEVPFEKATNSVLRRMR